MESLILFQNSLQTKSIGFAGSVKPKDPPNLKPIES